MNLAESEIRDILSQYDLGRLRAVRLAGTGFSSTNYAIATETGLYAIRHLFDTEDNVAYTLRLYNYLVSEGIKTARTIPTEDGRLYVEHREDFACVQTFIDGERGQRDPGLLPVYGRELGRVQAALAGATLEGKEEDACLPALGHLVPGMPNDPTVQRQYRELQEELASLPLDRFTQSIIHGDCSPGDFFFKGGRFVGILDFSAACPDYVLYDVASTMMYCGIYAKERKADFLRFIRPYREQFPLPAEEFASLHAFLKARFLIQVTYHWLRYREGMTYLGGTLEDNLQGVEDGRAMLKNLEKVPVDFYARALD